MVFPLLLLAYHSQLWCTLAFIVHMAFQARVLYKVHILKTSLPVFLALAVAKVGHYYCLLMLRTDVALSFDQHMTSCNARSQSEVPVIICS